MKIGELVTSEIEIVDPDDSLRTAAQMMAALDAGILPVCAEDRLLGTISDRDIAVRAIAGGYDPEATPVREIMSSDIGWVFADEEVEDVAQRLTECKVHRLAVLDRDRRLVGLVSLGRPTGGEARR